MSVSIGRVSYPESGLLEKLITILEEDHDIIVSEAEPPAPHEDGDVWYKPSEDRYRIYVEP